MNAVLDFIKAAAPLQRLRGMRRRYGANRNTGGQCA